MTTSLALYDPGPSRRISDGLLEAIYEADRNNKPLMLDCSAVADIMDETVRNRQRIDELSAALEGVLGWQDSMEEEGNSDRARDMDRARAALASARGEPPR
jgi:hypothetical protein